MRGSRGAAVLGLLLVLTGCVAFTLAKGGEKIDLGEGMGVRPAQDWNRLKLGKFEYWTLDGLRLQNILFVKGAEDGEPISPFSLNQQGDSGRDTLPKFRKGMTFLEVRELFEATLARKKAQNVVITDVEPGKFAGRDGFHFDFTFQNVDGLDELGTANGTIYKNKLYMAVYRGTKLYFYGRRKRDFDQILRSITLSQSTGIF